MTEAPQTIGVLICTWRRPAILARCLEALAVQQRSPDDVMVVVRERDTATRDYCAKRPPDCLKLRIVDVAQPGTVAALNAGLEACRTDLLAITDDDTVPWSDWLARIQAHFAAEPMLGGLGGRDRCHDGERFDDRIAQPVGRLQWFGRIIGNHHLGFGPARPTDLLKGANMSYRAAAVGAIRFDTRLRGIGAQPSEDIAFSLTVARAGWRLLYDPAVGVDHYAAVRPDVRHYASIGRLTDVSGFRDHAFNGVIALWDELPPIRQVAFLLWSFLVGTGTCPGLVQTVRFWPRLGLASWQRFWVAQQGKAEAYRMLLKACPKAAVARTVSTGNSTTPRDTVHLAGGTRP